MKSTIKIICIVLSLILLVCNGMVGCSSSSSEDETTTTKDSSSVSAMPPRDDINIYDFYTPEEFKVWLIPMDGADAPAMADAAKYGEHYCEFVEQFASGNRSIYLPYLGDNIISWEHPVNNPEGYPNIAVFTSDWMRKPWIWYYSLIDNVRYIVKVSYLSPDEASYASEHSAAEFIKHISPGTPNVDNRLEFEKYDAIYEDTATLSDRTVSVLRYDFAESVGYGDQITFVYDNLLVSIRAYGEFDESWLKDLSFQPLP